MATYPPHGTPDWDDELKAYIDSKAAADALTSHATDTTGVHGMTDTADLQTSSALDADVAALVTSGGDTDTALSNTYVTLRDTGWRRFLSWTGGVQDTGGQAGTIDLTNYALSGDGYIDVKRSGDWLFLRSNGAASSGIATLSTSSNALLTEGWPTGWRLNAGGGSAGYAAMAPIGHRGYSYLLFGWGAGGQGAEALITPGGATDITGIFGAVPCFDSIPTEPYPGVAAPA